MSTKGTYAEITWEDESGLSSSWHFYDECFDMSADINVYLYIWEQGEERVTEEIFVIPKEKLKKLLAELNENLK